VTREKTWKLRPSDFAFLWEECKRCFYLMVKQGFSRPSPPMPKIFTDIDARMKLFYRAKRTDEVNSNMPPGRFAYEDKMVRSACMTHEGRMTPVYIQGKFDAVIELDDGSYGVVDFKTSERNTDHLSIYSRQLHAYAYALEHATPGFLELRPVSTLGLLVYEPRLYEQNDPGNAVLHGHLAWVPLARDDKSFSSFISEVLDVLEKDNPPAPGESCPWCRYRRLSRSLRFEEAELAQPGLKFRSE
jgi:hypothetical protein